MMTSGVDWMLNNDESVSSPATSTMTVCGGCDRPILDRYLFHVLDKPWHAACIRCADCQTPLADKCFSRDGVILCRDDFAKRFGTKCAGCNRLVDRNDLVRRARDKVFHIDCFCCTVCRRRLDTGEQLYILNGTRFICKADYVAYRCGGAGSDCGSPTVDDFDDDDMAHSEELDLSSPAPVGTPTGVESPGALASGGKTSSHDENSSSGGCNSQSGAKRRGPRTTIKAKQLDTLKAAFAATPKPTRHIREQLAQETGLNMRVIQVWFQNRRSKERRMKQLRYGGYRPGRRNRMQQQRAGGGASVDGDLVGIQGVVFQDGRPTDAYFQQQLGFYCAADLYQHQHPTVTDGGHITQPSQFGDEMMLPVDPPTGVGGTTVSYLPPSNHHCASPTVGVVGSIDDDSSTFRPLHSIYPSSTSSLDNIKSETMHGW